MIFALEFFEETQIFGFSLQVSQLSEKCSGLFVLLRKQTTLHTFIFP